MRIPQRMWRSTGSSRAAGTTASFGRWSPASATPGTSAPAIDPLSSHYRDCRRSRYENYGSGTFLGEALEDAGVDLGRVIGRRGAPL